jgi:hypothetical protein
MSALAVNPDRFKKWRLLKWRSAQAATSEGRLEGAAMRLFNIIAPFYFLSVS